MVLMNALVMRFRIFYLRIGDGNTLSPLNVHMQLKAFYFYWMYATQTEVLLHRNCNVIKFTCSIPFAEPNATMKERLAKMTLLSDLNGLGDNAFPGRFIMNSYHTIISIWRWRWYVQLWEMGKIGKIGKIGKTMNKWGIHTRKTIRKWKIFLAENISGLGHIHICI